MTRNDPPGSMVGSGIYSDTFDGEVSCPLCGYAGPGEVNVNDYRFRYFECPSCGAEVDIPDDGYGDEEDEDG